MVRQTSVILASVLLMAVIIPTVAAHEHRQENEYQYDYRGFDDQDRIMFQPLPEGPGFSLKGRDHEMPLAFGPKQFVIKRNEVETVHSLKDDPWNMSFDPDNRTMDFHTTIIPKGSDPINLNFTLNPSLDGSKRIFYNLSLKGNLDMDEVLIRWGFDMMRMDGPPPPKEDFKWFKEREGLSLNDTHGRPMMKAMMYKHARFRNSTEMWTEDLPVNSNTYGENGTITMVVEINERLESVETSGYMEVFEEIIEFLDEAGDDAKQFIRDHLLSVTIGSVLTILLVTTSVLVLSRRTLDGSPERDLDYRKSRYFKPPIK